MKRTIVTLDQFLSFHYPDHLCHVEPRLPSRHDVRPALQNTTAIERDNAIQRSGYSHETLHHYHQTQMPVFIGVADSQ